MSLFGGKGPKTARGLLNKSITGDGRVDPVKQLQRDIGLAPPKKKRR
jgi:hypothetical protein